MTRQKIVRLYACPCCRAAWGRKKGEAEERQREQWTAILSGIRNHYTVLICGGCFVELKTARTYPKGRQRRCFHMKASGTTIERWYRNVRISIKGISVKTGKAFGNEE